METPVLILFIGINIIYNAVAMPTNGAATSDPNCIIMTPKNEKKVNEIVDKISDFLNNLTVEFEDFDIRLLKINIEKHTEDEVEKETEVQIILNDCELEAEERENVDGRTNIEIDFTNVEGNSAKLDAQTDDNASKSKDTKTNTDNNEDEKQLNHSSGRTDRYDNEDQSESNDASEDTSDYNNEDQSKSNDASEDTSHYDNEELSESHDVSEDFEEGANRAAVVDSEDNNETQNTSNDTSEIDNSKLRRVSRETDDESDASDETQNVTYNTQEENNDDIYQYSDIDPYVQEYNEKINAKPTLIELNFDESGQSLLEAIEKKKGKCPLLLYVYKDAVLFLN